MTPSLLSRSAAPAAIVAGALVIITRLVIMVTTPAHIDSLKVYVLTVTHGINSVASIIAFAMLVVAVVATYDIQARAAGVLGVIALIAAIFGTVFMAGDWWFEAFAVPRLAEVAPSAMDTFTGGRLLAGGLSSFLLFGIGWMTYGIASLRARVFPVAVSWTIVAGGLLSGVPSGFFYLAGNVILGLALIWLGIWYIRSNVTADARASTPVVPKPTHSA